jgi:DNA (cytosine-5)-methyltransferase 1
MFGGIPAFGGHSLAGSIEQSATLTAKDCRLDVESETFFVASTLAGGWRRSGGYSLDDIPLTAPALRAQAQCSHRADSEAFIVAGTLNANGKAAGSATQQDADSGLLVVHGTQDPDVRYEQAHTLGRNNGMENAVLAFSCKDHGADVGEIAPTLRAMSHAGSHANAGGQVAVCITGDVTHTLKADGFDGSEDGTGRGQPIVVCRDVAQTLTRNYGKQPDNTNSALGPNIVAAFTPEIAGTLVARSSRGGGQTNSPGHQADQQCVSSHSGVRRLTPRECERLQGFPDDYTLIPWRGKAAEECPDGPRYKAIGNSKAVPVVRWIGQRILKQITPSPYS